MLVLQGISLRQEGVQEHCSWADVSAVELQTIPALIVNATLPKASYTSLYLCMLLAP